MFEAKFSSVTATFTGFAIIDVKFYVLFSILASYVDSSAPVVLQFTIKVSSRKVGLCSESATIENKLNKGLRYEKGIFPDV